ncbi:hypothetical protein ACI2JR_17695 [Klebsiella sp. NPDC088457]
MKLTVGNVLLLIALGGILLWCAVGFIGYYTIIAVLEHFINRKRITYMNKRLMAEASRFQSSQERKRFWLLTLGTLAAALTGFFIFNFL